jgi:hypothetical protein
MVRNHLIYILYICADAPLPWDRTLPLTAILDIITNTLSNLSVTNICYMSICAWVHRGYLTVVVSVTVVTLGALFCYANFS